MIKRIFLYMMFLFMVIALVLHFGYGVRSIDLNNGSVWLRSVSHHFDYFRDWKIPEVPKIDVPSLADANWYEYIPVMLATIVNGFISLLNFVLFVQNTIDDFILLIVSIVWVFIDSVPDLLQSVRV